VARTASANAVPRGEGPHGDAAGAVARGGAARAAKGTRLAAARGGGGERGLASRLAPLGTVWRHALPLWGMPQYARLCTSKRGLQGQAK